MPRAKRARNEASGSSDSKRKYFQQSSKARDLTAGMRGVLVSSDVHLEREAIKESFRLFESLVDEDGESAPVDETESGAMAGDALAREIEALKQERRGDGAAVKGKSFSVAQTGCGGNVLIRFESDAHDPLRLVERVMEKAIASRGLDAPHIIRMVPVQATCAAKTAAIEAALTPLVGAALRGSEGTYAVQWRRRCNTDVDKMAIIDAAAGAVGAVAPSAKVDLRYPETGILTEVIKTTCCVGVLPNWTRYHQYNLRALTEAISGRAPTVESTTPATEAVSGRAPIVESTTLTTSKATAAATGGSPAAGNKRMAPTSCKEAKAKEIAKVNKPNSCKAGNARETVKANMGAKATIKKRRAGK